MVYNRVNLESSLCSNHSILFLFQVCFSKVMKNGISTTLTAFALKAFDFMYLEMEIDVEVFNVLLQFAQTFE